MSVALALAVPSLAFAQAQTSLASLRVGYNTRKATVKPEGELKTQIDAVDRRLADATRLGRTGEVRRLLAKGTTLLAGRAWTPELEFTTSVVIRSDKVVVDSTTSLQRAPRADLRAVTRAREPADRAPDAPAAPDDRCRRAARQGAVVKDLGQFDGVARDLRDAPFASDVDIQGVTDGTYQLWAELSDGPRSLGGVGLAVSVRKGLDDLVARLEAAAAQAPADVRADILFPVDRMRNVNRGSLELRTFDPERDFSEALSVAAAVKSGKQPFKDAPAISSVTTGSTPRTRSCRITCTCRRSTTAAARSR